MFCDLCKKECDATIQDDSFDYDGPMGTVCTQILRRVVSQCCGNPVYWDEECTVEVSPDDTRYEDRYDD